MPHRDQADLGALDFLLDLRVDPLCGVERWKVCGGEGGLRWGGGQGGGDRQSCSQQGGRGTGRRSDQADLASLGALGFLLDLGLNYTLNPKPWPLHPLPPNESAP
jgi:hypothetical protein